MSPEHPRLPADRSLPGHRRAAIRHVLEATVAHDRPRRWRRRWSWRGAVLLASAGGVLAGGGAAAYALSQPPSHHSTQAASGSASTATSATPARATTSGTAGGTGASVATVTPPVCAASQLSFTAGRAGVAMGTVSYPMIIRNASAAACNLYGYPGMQMLAATGGLLSTDVVRNSTMFGLPPEQMVILQPGQQAFFAVAFSDGTGYTGTHCPSASQVEITPPNAYTPATITWQIDPYSSKGECGTIQVSYVVAGTPSPYM